MGRFYWQLLPGIGATIYDGDDPGTAFAVCSVDNVEFICAALNDRAEKEKL